MRRPLAIIGAVVVSFGLGVLLAGSMGAPAEDGVAVPSELDIPVAAERPWFPPADQYDNGGEPLLDEDFEALMVALDAAMTAEETLADFDREADFHLWSFTRRLAVPEVGDEQQERINSYLDALAERHPDSRDMIERSRSMLGYYATALPEMPSFVSRALSAQGLMVYPSTGEMFTDAQLDRIIAALDAVFALPESTADFESGVEVSMSSIGWGLQRGRMSDEQTARVAEELVALKETYPAAAEALDRLRFHIEYLMPGRVDAEIVAAKGPIATEWGVYGWPTIFVLDEEGVILHVNKRGGALIETIDDLLMEKRMREWQEQAEAEAEAETEEADSDAAAEVGTG